MVENQELHIHLMVYQLKHTDYHELVITYLCQGLGHLMDLMVV